MPKAKLFLRDDERQELALLFYRYPTQRLYELIEDKVVPDDMLPYIPYIEGQINVTLMRALAEYDKNNERSKRKRPLYFKKYLDKASESHIATVVLQMRAAIARVEGRASRSALKADKELYANLESIAQGNDLLDSLLASFDS